ncbi:hypothetical protein I541_5250 [Mycobacteroides abscessus]|nr:hypothetical protein L836_5415 [Mycobacteroides abscessus MAB_110811_2726]EUA73041.1 hypothetical protein I541_5250 [Mycobacteroides abscessus]
MSGMPAALQRSPAVSAALQLLRNVGEIGIGLAIRHSRPEHEAWRR